jgi:uncharacterized protein (DUF302 family)
MLVVSVVVAAFLNVSGNAGLGVATSFDTLQALNNASSKNPDIYVFIFVFN